MNFISEKELEAQTTGGNEEPIDHRPLYERLKEVRDKAQAQREEELALKNQFRGLDEDETDFLDKVNKIKSDAEKKRKDEERELLKKCLRADAETSTQSMSITSLKPKMEKATSNISVKSQKETLKKLVVKRKAPEAVESSEAKQLKVLPQLDKEKQKDGETPTLDEDKKEPEKIKTKSGLLQAYASSSDEES